MACVIAPSPLSGIELERENRIAENRRRLEACGLLESAQNLVKLMKPAITKPSTRRATKPRERKRKTRHQPVRRSGRLCGVPAECGQTDENSCALTCSDEETGLKDLLAGDAEIESLSKEKQMQFQEMRCAATGRGSMYDSVAGITCHFCRQKKLCGEEGCPRCSRRSVSAECIGKSDCSKCHSATGRFCRACLLIRYGETLEDVRQKMAEGTWLCPHCYEEEHPEEGWMCNSSICMTRRGFKPTGIAIYDAQQRGFPSVAHWLQAQLLKSTSQAAAAAPPAAAAAAAGGSKPSVSAADSNAPESSAEASLLGDAEADTCGAAATGKAAAAAGKAAFTSLDQHNKAARRSAGTRHKPAAAAAAAAGRSSQAISQDICEGRDCDQKDTAAAAVAPNTPLKCCEGATPGPAAADDGCRGGGRAGARTTRAAAAAACCAKKAVVTAAPAAAAPASKRVCGVSRSPSACARRSLRFRGN